MNKMIVRLNPVGAYQSLMIFQNNILIHSVQFGIGQALEYITKNIQEYDIKEITFAGPPEYTNKFMIYYSSSYAHIKIQAQPI